MKHFKGGLLIQLDEGRVSETATNLHDTATVTEFAQVNWPEIEGLHQVGESAFGLTIIPSIEEHPATRTGDLPRHELVRQRVEGLDDSRVVGRGGDDLASGQWSCINLFEIGGKLIGHVHDDPLLVVRHLSEHIGRDSKGHRDDDQWLLQGHGHLVKRHVVGKFRMPRRQTGRSTGVTEDNRIVPATKRLRQNRADRTRTYNPNFHRNHPFSKTC